MTPPKLGQSAEQLSNITDLPDGVVDASATYSSSLSGFTRSYFLEVQIEIADDVVVADAADEAVLQWAWQLGWSVNDHDPTGVYVRLVSASGAPVEWDYEGAYEAVGLDRKLTTIPNGDSPWIGASARDLESLYGAWPGSVPVPPASLFTPAS
ncbi:MULTISPECIES: hypothetical protein [unclassified Salinibacterium]|uniref:hypothetical protein n=1 Tax=unclassified Salinibacterium TaxID=2632331 RepID=UPI0018CF4F9C|nr:MULTISPECIES: hypothetical protein [unclassified Salinibacterium]MBH0053113.1 hypothetical protein [Salinibacterium sp. SWN139]MBH0082378.1 hypothetical protein [Salinibacterium sp. SWN167]